MKNRLAKIKSDLCYKKSFIDIQKEYNRQYDDFKDDIDRSNYNIGKLEEYKNKLNSILNAVEKEDAEFKDRRLNYIKSIIESNLDFIFPEKEFSIKIVPKIIRGKAKSGLALFDKYGHELDPEENEGGLLQELLAFSSSLTIISLLGGTSFFIDEAFGASSMKNKPKLGNIINHYIDEGLQILLVSQSPSLYDFLDRREINLKLNEDTLTVEVDSIEDVKGDLANEY